MTTTPPYRLTDETGGGTIADNHGVAALINRIIDWAAQTEI